MAIRARNLKAVKAVYLTQANVFLDVAHLRCDHRKRFIKVEIQGWMKIWCGFDVLNTLPSIHYREFCALSRQNRRQRRGLCGTSGRAMFVGEVKAEFVLIVLNRLERCHLDIRVPGKATRVDAPRVVTCFSVHDLLRQQPAMAAALSQTGAQTDDAEGIAFSRDRANQWGTVYRIGDRPIHDRMNARFHQGRHPLECAFQNICDAIQIIGAKGIHKVRVNPVHAPCFAILLIEANQQTVLLLTAVIVTDRAA